MATWPSFTFSLAEIDERARRGGSRLPRVVSSALGFSLAEMESWAVSLSPPGPLRVAGGDKPLPRPSGGGTLFFLNPKLRARRSFTPKPGGLDLAFAFRGLESAGALECRETRAARGPGTILSRNHCGEAPRSARRGGRRRAGPDGQGWRRRRWGRPTRGRGSRSPWSCGASGAWCAWSTQAWCGTCPRCCGRWAARRAFPG